MTLTIPQAADECQETCHRLEPYGFDADTTVQHMAPWAGTVYEPMVVQHCGMTVGTLYTKAGLTMSAQAGDLTGDFPHMAYTPAVALDVINSGPVESGGWLVTGTPQEGDFVILDWGYGGWANWSASDHAVYLRGAPAWPASFSSRGWNEDEYGAGVDSERPSGLVVVVGRPRNLTQAHIDAINASIAEATPAGPAADTYAGRIYARMKTWGFTDAGIAGALGNFQQESGIDPTATEGYVGWENLGDGEHEGAGIAQWSFERRTQLASFAAAQARTWDDLDLQLDYMRWELDNTHQAADVVGRTATDPVSAALDWEEAYESARIKGPREQYAVEQMAKILAGDYTPAGVATPVTYRPPRDQATLIVLAWINNRRPGRNWS